MSKKNRHETCFSDNQLVGIFGKKISTQTKRNQSGKRSIRNLESLSFLVNLTRNFD